MAKSVPKRYFGGARSIKRSDSAPWGHSFRFCHCFSLFGASFSFGRLSFLLTLFSIEFVWFWGWDDQKKRIYVLYCPHLPLQPYEIIWRRLTHLLVSNRMQIIAYGCRGNSEQEDIDTFFRPFFTNLNKLFLVFESQIYLISSKTIKKKRIYVLYCPHLPLQTCKIVCRRLTHFFVSNRMHIILHVCRGNSEQEDIDTFFRPFFHKSQ